MLVEHTKAVPQSSGMMRQPFWHVHSTRGRIRWSPVSDPMVLSEQAAWCRQGLLAALARDPAARCIRRVGGLAEHARLARGASWPAARRPQGGGRDL